MSLPEARDSQHEDDAKRRMSRRALVRGFVGLIAAAPALAGCADGGFRPMYASSAFGGSGNLEQKFAQVDVQTIPGRVGQRIRNELIFQNTGGGAPLPHVYKLEVAIREGMISTLIRPNGDAAGQIYTIEAAFRLSDLKNKTVVLEGVSYSRAGFERFTSIYANVQAKQDAENRAAKVVADEIKTRLAAYLSSRA